MWNNLTDARVELHPDIRHEARRVAHAIRVGAVGADLGDLLEYGS